MRFVLLLTLLFSLGLAHAEPAPSPATGDEMSRFINERGFLARIGDVSNKVTNRASELVMNSMAFLGVPYKRGGTQADSGFDCSGFVRAIYEQTAGLLLPRQASEQAAATQKIDKHELQPGDLVFFNTMRRTFSHVGIYVGNGKFIHSPKPGAEVRVEDMGISYWAKRFDGARRVNTDPAAQAPAR
nr:C40 family peptidase [uncultured Rhodoferax sp.]